MDIFNLNVKELEKIRIIELRKQVTELCDDLWVYMQILVEQNKKPLVFDRFVLVRALEEIFYPELSSVAGFFLFSTAFEIEISGIHGSILAPHHCLQIKNNPNYLIDVLPLDGEFGIAVPQVVTLSKNFKRFFESSTIYPEEWTEKEKSLFHGQVKDLVDILESLQEKSPS